MVPEPRSPSLGTALAVLCCGILLAALKVSSAQPDDVAAKSHRAKQAMGRGQFDEASVLYAELVRAVPDNPGLRLDLGLALHSAGRYGEAVGQFQTFLKQQPDSTPAWLLLGLDYLKLGRASEAVGPLNRVVGAEPTNKLARLELGQALLSVNRLDEALAQLESLTRLDPNYAEGWQALGLTYNALSRRAFDQLEKSAPDSAYHDALLARSLVSRNQFLRGFSIYKQAMEKDSGLRATYEGLAEIYERTGHADWAAVERKKKSALPLPDCSVQKYECEFRAGHYAQLVNLTQMQKTPESSYWQSQAYTALSQEALAHLAQLPPSAAVHGLMAEAYRMLGRYDLSIQEWREALKLEPNGRQPKEGVARALWLNHEYQEAQALLVELLQAQPESAQLNYELGDTLARRGEAARAIPYLEKAVKYSPENKAAHDSLGRAYMQAGQPEKAIPHFQAALGLNEEVYYQLAQAYRKAGQQELAEQTMQKFQDVSRAAQLRKPQHLEDFQITPP